MKVGLLASAFDLANLAVGEWETWDFVDVPPLGRLRKLGIYRASEIIQRTKSDLEQLANPDRGRSHAATPVHRYPRRDN